MSYQALYRKYRPQSFDTVIGQAHITTILKNQVRSGHIAHAYLFSGTRGTGKTTTARIFARAINCLDPQDGEPCGRCAACLASAAENADIIELDAASNSSVDDIRALVEKARYTPLQLRYKVYIIDEAHALASSSQAFNALLKTLEEPPAHVVFILATTEPQKLPATIRSRCQRLDFHRLRVNDMAALLRDVLQKSGASIEEEGLLCIARSADGGMRDALSLADQCLAFCGDHVSTADVYRVLGSMEGDFLFQMADALLAGDAAAALRQLDRAIADGRDLTVFTHDLALHMRALLITKICGASAALLDCTNEDAARYAKQAEAAGETRLLQAVEQLTAVQAELKWLLAPRPRVESVLVRIAAPEEARSLADILARVELLEEKLRAGVPAIPQIPRETASQAGETPPWETPQDAATGKATLQKAPAQAPQKPPKAAAAAAPAATTESAWKQAMQKLKTEDMALYAMALRAKASESGGQITLRFEQPVFAQAMQKKLDVLQAAAGCPVGIADGAKKEEDTPEARARALFGDTLKITD